ncbi:hypothetical protein QJS10_CPB19g00937 [Acorus calamus]|uniref:BUB1 N-terminal domain-containing protein n=1 Tax=Acorus calamus TaxID=4465 RepID=A0AAV9CHT7_ACOCL|nr:hypothetical protein QJS10_CPB19g00937 [Acorus calamus]
MEDEIRTVDPELEFLISKRETGNEWELYKENVRPLKRGRKVHLLNQSLKSHADPLLKKSLLEKRRSLIEAIDEYKGEDPLHPWLECIKWVQESFPSGGDSSGLLLIYEQCVRTFWHEDRYKDDLRYLKVWLEYAEYCADAEVIYCFLDANQIGKTHSEYYLAYALHMESKNKMRKADDIFNLGIARKSHRLEKLEAAYKKFLARSLGKKKNAEDEMVANRSPIRSFGTVLATGEARRQASDRSDMLRKRAKLQRHDGNAPLPIYNDGEPARRHQPETLGQDENSWHTLGSRLERNKENTSLPAKWTSYKVPQKAVPRIGSSNATRPSPCIDVFVDDECAELPKKAKSSDNVKPSVLQLKRDDGRYLKRESELLKENPLRNFPLNSLPR